MYFILDKERKVALGWSAKCGCTHIKSLYVMIQNINKDIDVHKYCRWGSIESVDNICDYTIILFIRNPYSRLVSGFVDKHGVWREDHQLKTVPNWELTFHKFVNILTKSIFTPQITLTCDPEGIDYHHFTPQTTEKFCIDKIQQCKTLKVFDIENIDYDYLKDIFDFHGDLQNAGYGPHKHVDKTNNYTHNLYDVPVTDLVHEKYHYSEFYNKDIYEKVKEFYKNDLEFFAQHGFVYDLEIMK